MNPKQRVPLIICITFGICLGHLLVEFASMVVRTMALPLINGVFENILSGLDSQYLQIGSFISGCIVIGLTGALLWFAWLKFAVPQLNKDIAQ